MTQLETITFKELEKIASSIEGLDKVRLKHRIDLVQINEEYYDFIATSKKFMTFLEYINCYYPNSIIMILKLNNIEDSCFDRYKNINEEIFHIKNKKKHTVPQAYSFVYFIQNEQKKY